jgi:hypothetical protein
MRNLPGGGRFSLKIYEVSTAFKGRIPDVASAAYNIYFCRLQVSLQIPNVTDGWTNERILISNNVINAQTNNKK